MKGKYDNIATFYDSLAHLVFGDAILLAHSFLANEIPADSSVLIIGGGTGFILEEISKKHFSGLKITYVDISKKMIALSEKRSIGNNKIYFINKSILDVEFHKKYDAVITPFFFDNFLNSNAEVIFNKISAALKPQGLWLFADFQLNKKSKWWQKPLLNFMYFFFRLLCGVEAFGLPDTNFLFLKNKYQFVSKRTFYKGFIYSIIYKRQ